MVYCFISPPQVNVLRHWQQPTAAEFPAWCPQRRRSCSGDSATFSDSVRRDQETLCDRYQYEKRGNISDPSSETNQTRTMGSSSLEDPTHAYPVKFKTELWPLCQSIIDWLRRGKLLWYVVWKKKCSKWRWYWFADPRRSTRKCDVLDLSVHENWDLSSKSTTLNVLSIKIPLRINEKEGQTDSFLYSEDHLIRKWLNIIFWPVGQPLARTGLLLRQRISNNN